MIDARSRSANQATVGTRGSSGCRCVVVIRLITTSFVWDVRNFGFNREIVQRVTSAGTDPATRQSPGRNTCRLDQQQTQEKIAPYQNAMTQNSRPSAMGQTGENVNEDGQGGQTLVMVRLFHPNYDQGPQRSPAPSAFAVLSWCAGCAPDESPSTGK